VQFGDSQAFQPPDLPEPTRYAFAPPVPKEQAGRPLLKRRVAIVGVALRGYPFVDYMVQTI
jgi:hypothetical protein